MCASESCGSSCDTQSSTYRNVKWALSSCNSKICQLFSHKSSLLSVITQFAGGFVPDESGNYKNLEVKYEDNSQFEETPLRGKS